MPANLDALLRYHTIDNCLQNRFRKWNLEALASHCAEALAEADSSKGEKSTVSIPENVQFNRPLPDFAFFYRLALP